MSITVFQNDTAALASVFNENFQKTLAEYSSLQTYSQYSVVRKTGTYEVYGSLVNSNLGNALPNKVDDSNWRYLGSLYGIGNVLIQGYTLTSNVGTALQQFAGRDYTLAELQAYFGAAKVISYNRFGAGAALGTDDVGTYNYTLGAASKAPSNSVGIMGTNYAIRFDGGDYATNATKFDNMTTTFSGAGKGLIHSFWFNPAADGQPSATMVLFNKTNSVANDYYIVQLPTNGLIEFLQKSTTGAVAKDYLVCSAYPNGATSLWKHIVIAQNTTTGIQIYVDKRIEVYDVSDSAKILMADGTTTDFFIGGTDATPANSLTGTLANEIVINNVCTQAMVDFLYASTIPIPAVLQGNDFKTQAMMRPQIAVGGEREVWCDEVLRTNTALLISGGTRCSTDYYKLTGRLS